MAKRLSPFERLEPEAQLRRALLVLNYENTPMSISDVGELLGAPTALTRTLLQQLTDAGRAVRITTGRGHKFKPALRDPLMYYLRKRK